MLYDSPHQIKIIFKVISDIKFQVQSALCSCKAGQSFNNVYKVLIIFNYNGTIKPVGFYDIFPLFYLFLPYLLWYFFLFQKIARRFRKNLTDRRFLQLGHTQEGHTKKYKAVPIEETPCSTIAADESISINDNILMQIKNNFISALSASALSLHCK